VKSNLYTEQVRLLVALLPSVAKQSCFALPALVRVIRTAMTEGDKRFLLALKRGDQDWRDFALPEAARLPAIQWKMLNLARMQPAKRRQAADKLETILFG
jgi:hypothetical protein